MANTAPETRTSPRRARKSIAAFPMSSSIPDQENVTIAGFSSTLEKPQISRRARSKSIGAGGLEALAETSGNRQKVFHNVRSILKPTIPISPVQAIPARNEQAQSPSRTTPTRKSPRNAKQETNAQNEGTPSKDKENLLVDVTEVVDPEKEREEALAKEQREAERKAIQERRDARRKSLAARRVSFAPEATMHTFHLIEVQEDATSSSEATNSTRRQSSGTMLMTSSFQHGPQGSPVREDTLTGEILVAASPARPQSRRRRRSSTGLNRRQSTEFSSSPLSSSMGEDTREFGGSDDDIIDASDSDEDRDLVVREDTIGTIDGMDDTRSSIGSRGHSSIASDSSERLNNSLRLAAQTAGISDTNYFQNSDDDLMDLDEVVTAYAQPTTQVDYNLESPRRVYEAVVDGVPFEQDAEDDTQLSMDFTKAAGQILQNLQAQEEATMDMTVAGGGILGRGRESNSENSTINLTSNSVGNDNEQTMEMTKAIGSILPSPGKSPRGKRKSMGNTRRSSVGRRKSVESQADDQSMDFTTAVGRIQRAGPSTNFMDSDDEDEEMTMELTAVVGSVLQNENNSNAHTAEEHDNIRPMDYSRYNSNYEDDHVPQGLSPITEHTEPSVDTSRSFAMDLTQAGGNVLSSYRGVQDKDDGKSLLEAEVDGGFFNAIAAKRRSTTPRQSIGATESGSPFISSARSDRRRSLAKNKSPVASSPLQKHSEATPSTPSRQVVEQAIRSATPAKTPTPRGISVRGPSPVKLFKPAPQSGKSERSIVFKADPVTGKTVPSIVLEPKARRFSGIGLDQPGLGSPRVTELLDRRASLGEQAEIFTPLSAKHAGVRFEDPRALDRQVTLDLTQHRNRESGRGVLEAEVDGDIDSPYAENTGTLRGLIETLTPKKSKLKGRKSLAVGGGKGLLGKRPLELDLEDETPDPSPKRFAGQSSPVKRVHLPGPPSVTETTGRLTRGARNSLKAVSGNASMITPILGGVPGELKTTPRGQTRFKDVHLNENEVPITLNERLAGIPSDAADRPAQPQVHLQEFLDLIGIRFIELSATKRRHTTVARPEDDVTGLLEANPNDPRDFESCVVAGAATVPMLELYQHACRELKDYIAVGRETVKEIEEETYGSNPALFKEYMSAGLEARVIMDNQFKNAKTHSRLISKGLWYDWRMKLTASVKQGLVERLKGLQGDASSLENQQVILNEIVPPLVEEHDKLLAEAEALQKRFDELNSADMDELRKARSQLLEADSELAKQKKILEKMQSEKNKLVSSVNMSVERKTECILQTGEALRVQEQCRGYSVKEVSDLKAVSDLIESEHGWTILSAEEEKTIVLRYKKAICLTIEPSAFNRASGRNGVIRLSMSEDAAPSTESRFFIQSLRAQLLVLEQASSSVKDVMELISSSYNNLEQLSQEIRRLQCSFVTTVAITSDETLSVCSSVLLREMKTRLESRFVVHLSGSGTENRLTTSATANVIYGESLKEDKMTSFLMSRIAHEDVIEGWADAVKELEERALARGKRETTT